MKSVHLLKQLVLVNKFYLPGQSYLQSTKWRIWSTQKQEHNHIGHPHEYANFGVQLNMKLTLKIYN